MKVYKKITALAVALTMGCSVVAFAACTPKDEEETGNNNLPTGTPAQAIDTTFSSALEEAKNYLSLNYTNKMTGTEVNTVTENGALKSTETTTYERNMAISGKVDLQNGNADLLAKLVSTYESTDKNKDFTSQLQYNNSTSYAFIRDWNAFTYDTPDNKEVTDFTGVQLEYGSSLKIDWEEILGQFIPTDGDSDTYDAESSGSPIPDLSVLPQTGDLVSLGLLGENVVLVRLAAAANTLNNKNGVYSIDLIETFDAIINEVGSVVAALEEKNTVGDILNNAIIKKYFSVITELVPVETVKDTVATAIKAVSANENLQSVMPQIKNDLNALKTINASTTYDYIVSLVSSQNLVNILNTLFGSMQGVAAASSSSGGALFTKTLDKYTVGDVLSTLNAVAQSDVSLKDLQVAYKYLMQSICDGEKINLGGGSAITGLGVEYTLENGKLASQKVNFAFEEQESFGVGDGYYDESGNEFISTQYSTVTNEKQEGSLEITFETSAPALADISANAVTYRDYEWDETSVIRFYVQDYNGEGGEKMFYVGAKVVDGNFTGFNLFDENHGKLGEGTDSVEFQAGDTKYVIYKVDETCGGGQDRVEFYVEAAELGIETGVTLYQTEVTRTTTVAEFLQANA